MDKQENNHGHNQVHDDLEGIIPPTQNPRLIGHDGVLTLLERMLSQKHLHHALLLEGPQGIGKATLGVHLAWHMLSNKIGNLRHVDINSTDWRQITIGAHPGFLHISRPFDSKTQKFRANITVEEIRKITHFLHQTAAGNGWRIIMIDSVDDINRNGANALLKTLEEPPPKALFILISHNKGKLLPTLRSRCQALSFKSLDEKQLKQILVLITGESHIEEKNDEIKKIMQMSEGSVRKALLMLQFGGMEIAHTIESILQTRHFNIQETYRLANALAAKDAQLQFVQFIDYLLRWIGNKAVEASLVQDLRQAERFANLYQTLSHDVTEAQAYNLDKKHFIVVLLNRVHGIVSAHETAKG